ncbi:unnamed protein product [Owenia fusiformis]|uniref:Exonuclease 1 n=1 Tax=Owenia fusiformis TaxID=6347 RepID=A0A8J1U4Z8_OWEFU|nr:unnamed protein product [Owenia fusiformis]
MGISGLLPFLKNASKQANIKEYKGCTVAIDTYCWLHKGAFACAEKLGKGEKTDTYVWYVMKFVNNLLSWDIKPIMVFDGCHLPSKKGVEKSRRERRELYRKKAAQYLREGKKSEARDCFTKCIDITPLMALEVMQACRAKGVDCIVAPYEADSQLAYLSKTGIAQVIITEDSDLVLFGCKKVMFKMDIAGNGILIERMHLNKATQIQQDYFTFDKFRYMCILSGCDYLPSLPGIGLGKACKLFKITRQADMTMVIRKLPTTLKMSQLIVPQDYIDAFFRANNTFLYQLVFDPLERRLRPLNDYPPDINRADLDYAGPYIPMEKAYQIALGNINVNNGQIIGDFDPDTYQPPKRSDSWTSRTDTPLHKLSIWHPNYRKMADMAQVNQTVVEVDPPTTRGKETTISTLPGLKKFSPRKRPRAPDTPEVDPSSKSEPELMDLYTTITDENDIFNPKKKLKITPAFHEFKPENKAYEANDYFSKNKVGSEWAKPNKPNTDSDNDSDDNDTPKRQSVDDKLSLAYMEKTTAHLPSLPDTAEIPTKLEEKLKTPPGLNKFAVSTGGKKKFNLSATKLMPETKAVKSRFFTSTNKFAVKKDPEAQPITSFFDTPQPIIKPANQSIINAPKTTTVNEKKSEPELNVNDHKTNEVLKPDTDSAESNNTTSAHRLFSWATKFESKYAKSDSESIDKNRLSQDKNQYKPVVPSKNTENASQKSESSLKSEDAGSIDTNELSQYSNGYSIDTSQISMSQILGSQSLGSETEETPTPADIDSGNFTMSEGLASTEVEEPPLLPSMDPDGDAAIHANSPPLPPLKSSPSSQENSKSLRSPPGVNSTPISAKSGQSKTMGSCRRTGLARTQGKTLHKKKLNNENDTSGKQKKIQSFFTQFTYKNTSSKTDKLAPAKRQPLSPNKDNATPEGDPVIHRTGADTVQRKLLT